MASGAALTVLACTARGRGRQRSWLLLALGTVALLGGGVPMLADAATDGQDVTGERDVGVVPAARVARMQPAGSLEALPSASRPAAAVSPPVRLKFLRLAVDASVRPVSVGADAELGVPTDPRQVGWWSSSGRPGAPSGSIVIAGHVDSATLGLGALFRLREARSGDVVTLVDARGTSTRYMVVARRSYPKTALPTAEVFALDAGPRLVLITCGGRFDEKTRHYDDNVVVYAIPRDNGGRSGTPQPTGRTTGTTSLVGRSASAPAVISRPTPSR